MKNRAAVKPQTDKEKGEAYKAHWESNWKDTAAQARARKTAETAAAKTSKPQVATPPPPTKGAKTRVPVKSGSFTRRRGRGAGGGQFV